jgi:hypothetical protein
MKKMSKLLNNRMGLSLVEVLIACGILSGAAFFIANILHKEKRSEDYQNRIMDVKKDAFLVLEKRVRVAFDRRRNISAEGSTISERGYEILIDGALAINSLIVVNDKNYKTISCRVYDVTFYTDCLDSSSLSPSLLRQTANIDFGEILTTVGLDPSFCKAGERPIVYMKRSDYVGGAKLSAKIKPLVPVKVDNFRVKDEVISAALGFKDYGGYVTARLAIGVFDNAGKYNIMLKTIYLGTGQYTRHGITKNICTDPKTCCEDEYFFSPI